MLFLVVQTVVSTWVYFNRKKQSNNVQIWDLRTGKVLNSLQFESPIKDLQFDSRKIMIAGVNDGLALYNRVSDEYESLKIGSTVNTLEYLDTYMVTGSDNGEIKCWAI